MLSNDELLEEEREKAKKIRERMSGITGSSSYGSYSSSSAYDSYNNKNIYQNKGYGAGRDQVQGGVGVYGDYSYGKSTLDKYKGDKQHTEIKSNLPDITGGLGGKS